jgi:hypothetical protein
LDLYSKKRKKGQVFVISRTTWGLLLIILGYLDVHGVSVFSMESTKNERSLACLDCFFVDHRSLVELYKEISNFDEALGVPPSWDYTLSEKMTES